MIQPPLLELSFPIDTSFLFIIDNHLTTAAAKEISG